MAVYRKPILKYKRRFGLLAEGESRRKDRFSRKKSNFGVRLEEKQKLKFIYKIMERQFSRYVREAFEGREDPAKAILQKLETRLDNVVYRAGFALTRAQARQLVSHGHVLVSGEKVTVPSYQVRAGEEIFLSSKIGQNSKIKELMEERKNQVIPFWLKREENKVTVVHLPAMDELREDINMSYVVELYR